MPGMVSMVHRGADVDGTFLEQDALQQRVLIPEHEAFIRRTAVALLETL